MSFFSRTPMPTPEERRSADPNVADQRRSDAVRHYERTGDGSRMWQEKSRHADAVRKVRAYDSTPQGRREARRARKET